MLLKRCVTLYLEPREDVDLDLSALFAGTSALGSAVRWIALAPHLGHELEVGNEEVAALGAIGPTFWVEREGCERRFGGAAIARLLALGLLIGDSAELAPLRERDDTLRSQHWHPLGALTHVFSRWEDVCAETGTRFPTFTQLQAEFGPPPPAVINCAPPEAAVALPAPDVTALDATLLRRYTGRNFDTGAGLPLALAARLLQRTFGAQDQRLMAPNATAPGALALKKTSPSGGSLHPVEAYVLVQRVEEVAPGLYHYHPLRHVLEPLQQMDKAAAHALAFEAVANQDWFAAAPMLVVLAARVERNFWKYRSHAKSYRALMLDAGHLSQTFYLLASEAGIPAFITAAVNEIKIEQALGLDPLRHAVIAVCGCGYAAAEAPTVEFRYGGASGQDAA